VLVAAGDDEATPVILRLMALGLVDAFVPEPWRSPDEAFHRRIVEFVRCRSTDGLPSRPDVDTFIVQGRGDLPCKPTRDKQSTRRIRGP
jgi:hypothetical protein